MIFFPGVFVQMIPTVGLEKRCFVFYILFIAFYYLHYPFSKARETTVMVSAIEHLPPISRFGIGFSRNDRIVRSAAASTAKLKVYKPLSIRRAGVSQSGYPFHVI
jgi:hypothetical protein